jgi:hypothetical protein
MHIARPLHLKACLLACAGLMAGPRDAGAAESDVIAAVSSIADGGYVRARLPDGSFQPESYAFGEGGRTNAPVRDDTIDKLNFMAVAQTVALPLAGQSYLPAKDPKNAKLLIMLYWGTTTGTSDASDSAEYQRLQDSQVLGAAPTPPPPSNAAMVARSGGSRAGQQAEGIQRQVGVQNFNSTLATVTMEDKQRAAADALNAALLGYDAELTATQGLEGTSLRHEREDLLAEVEDSRYFVVLMAYDFQIAWKDKKHKLLWVTRMSVRQKGNDFGRALPAMTRYASQYFGQNTKGLIRRPLPEGHVEVGQPRSLGVVPDK